MFHQMIKSITENKVQLKMQGRKSLSFHIWSKLVLWHIDPKYDSLATEEQWKTSLCDKYVTPLLFCEKLVPNDQIFMFS